MRTITPKLILVVFAIVLCGLNALAQDENPQPNQDAKRPNQQVRMLQALGLTPEQVQQIRRINAERRPITQEAQIKLRTANRALDLAIYSEAANEDEIKEKMKDVQLAQAELIKVRTLTEYQIRRVLTNEQLEKFRTLRERLMNRQNEPNNETKRPVERIRERRMQRPQN